jgi:putative membrane protein
MEMFAGKPKERSLQSCSTRRDVQTYKRIGRQSGLYNGFLSAGLIWSFLIKDPQWQDNVALFFLGCVAVAGIYGAISSTKKIFFVQALPAILAIIAVLLQ